MKTYLFSYVYNGSWYSFEIPAEDEVEARARLYAIQTRKVEFDGTLEARIAADLPGAQLVVRLLAWLGNLGRRQ